MAEAVDTRPPPPPAATGATGDTNDISIDESPTPAATAPSRVSLDRGAAAAAIGNVLVGKCHVRGGPSGNGHITIDISPTGRISSAVVDTAPYVGTTVGSCVARLYMQQVKVPPFDGPPVRVGKSFTLP